MSKGRATVRSANVRRREADLWNSEEKRRKEREDKRVAVLLTAAEMFLERGSHRVTMNDLADELGITKPALYNYFASKDEILFECFHQSNEVITSQIAMIENAPGTGLDRLSTFIRAYVRHITTVYGSVMIRLEDRDLPDEMRAQVRGFKRSIDARVRAMVAQGVDDGSIVPCDVKLATFVMLGALNWTGQWYDDEGSDSIDKISEEFLQRLTTGLKA